MQRTQPATAQPGRQNQHDGKTRSANAPAYPGDGRAIGLRLTPAGNQLMQHAENTATELESDVSSRLTAAEAKTLLRLPQKVYLRPVFCGALGAYGNKYKS